MTPASPGHPLSVRFCGSWELSDALLVRSVGHGSGGAQERGRKRGGRGAIQGVFGMMISVSHRGGESRACRGLHQLLVRTLTAL